MPAPATDMGGRLAETLRSTFAPADSAGSIRPFDTRLADIFARLDRVGEDRRGRPFCPDNADHR